MTTSSFGAQSGANLKEIGLAFNSALGELTQAIFRSADALNTGRTASSTTSAFLGPPQNNQTLAVSPEETAYYAPFTNYASLDTSAYVGYQPRQPAPSSGDTSRSEPVQAFELYFDANYDEINPNRFKSELVEEFRRNGAEEQDLSQLSFEVGPGSVVVKISGPASAIQAVSRLPLRNINVFNCRALLSKEELGQDGAITARSSVRSHSTTSSAP
jgi:hypothetical protein